MFRALLPLAGFVLLLLMVVAGAGAASGSLGRQRPATSAAPDNGPPTLSEWEIIVAVLATVVAIPVTIRLHGEFGIGVAMVPAVVWLLVVAVLAGADARRERAAEEERAVAEAARHRGPAARRGERTGRAKNPRRLRFGRRRATRAGRCRTHQDHRVGGDADRLARMPRRPRPAARTGRHRRRPTEGDGDPYPRLSRRDQRKYCSEPVG